MNNNNKGIPNLNLPNLDKSKPVKKDVEGVRLTYNQPTSRTEQEKKEDVKGKDVWDEDVWDEWAMYKNEQNTGMSGGKFKKKNPKNIKKEKQKEENQKK